MNGQISKSASRSMIFDKKNVNGTRNDLSELKNKSSLLDLSVGASDDEGFGKKLLKGNNRLSSQSKLKVEAFPEEEDFSDMASPKTNKNESQVGTSKNPQMSKAFLDDFKKYLEYRQSKKSQQRSQYSSLVLSDYSSSRMQPSNHQNNMDHVEPETVVKQEYLAKVQKHKDQTKKIMLEINKKLKIQPKTKQERFEDQMQVFKNTDTYIEIKPFLEQLNKVNHQKFIQQIARYENNIKVAQQYQQQDDFLRASDVQQSEFYGGNTPKKNDEIYMRKFEDLLAKAYSQIIRSNNFQNYKLLQSNIIQKLMEDLGYFDPNVDNSEASDQKENITKNENETAEQSSPVRKTSQRYSSKDKQNTASTQQLPKIKRKPSLDIGDLTSDDNQFFINLKEYLNKAQKDINLKIELENELNTYAQVIEENQRKIEEAKLEQLKKFMGGKLDPEHLFEGDNEVQLKEYYQRFRDKAEQVRSTLHKVNQQLFQKKWANAQIKRQMERQRERNQLLSQFKNNKLTNNDDLMNPSKRMNERILRNRKKQTGGDHDLSQSLLSHNSLNEEGELHKVQPSNRSITTKKDLQKVEEKATFLTAPVEVSSTTQQQTIPSVKNMNYQLNSKYTDPTTEKKFKSIHNKINANSINLPLIQSTKSLQSSHLLSPIKSKQSISVQQTLTTKNSNFDSVKEKPEPQLFKSTSKNGSQTPLSIMSKKNSPLNSIRNSSALNLLPKRLSIMDPYSKRVSLYAQQQQQSYTEEEQQKIEQLINEIDEEHQEYINEKINIKTQIQIISQNFEQEMSKYQRNENIDSIRGIQSDIPQHQYHSGLKISQSKYKPKNI